VACLSGRNSDTITMEHGTAVYVTGVYIDIQKQSPTEKGSRHVEDSEAQNAVPQLYETVVVSI